MDERMIAIPYKEYEELQNIKSAAKANNMKVYVKREIFGLRYSYEWWEVYTKDQAVERITDELIEARKELEDMRKERENKKESLSTGNLAINVLLLCIMAALVYLIFKSV
jgi:chromosome segregation ATPase